MAGALVPLVPGGPDHVRSLACETQIASGTVIVSAGRSWVGPPCVSCSRAVTQCAGNAGAPPLVRFRGDRLSKGCLFVLGFRGPSSVAGGSVFNTVLRRGVAGSLLSMLRAGPADHA
jgi:hypothetical protein